MKAFQSVILVTAAVFLTLAQTSFNPESGEAIAQSLPSKVQPAIDYAARAQAQRDKVDELQAQNPQMNKTDVSRACAMSDFQTGMNNHDPHALDWAFIPGKSGVPIAQDPKLSLQLTTMRQRLQANFKKDKEFAAWHATENQTEANRQLTTQFGQIDTDPTLDTVTKGVQQQALVRQALLQGTVSAQTAMGLNKQAEASAQGFAKVDNGPVTTTFMTDLALGKMSPEAIVERTEDLKAQGKLTEESFNYFLRQAYNVKQWQVAMSDWQQEAENPAYPPRIDLQVENTELHCDESPFTGLQDCKVSFLITGRSDSPKTSEKSYTCNATLKCHQANPMLESDASGSVIGYIYLSKGYGSKYERVWVTMNGVFSPGSPVTEVRLANVECY